VFLLEQAKGLPGGTPKSSTCGTRFHELPLRRQRLASGQERYANAPGAVRKEEPR